MSLVIEKKTKIFAPKAWIWNALTDPSELENWWSEDVTLDAKVGGRFKEIWEDDNGNEQVATGKVIALQKEKFITFIWQEKSWPKTVVTECTLRIEEQGKECTLTVEHSGWEQLTEKIQKSTMKEFELGWNYHLQELKSYLED